MSIDLSPEHPPDEAWKGAPKPISSHFQPTSSQMGFQLQDYREIKERYLITRHQLKKTNPMKKTILAKYLAVALAAGLTSFAGSAKAGLLLSINDSDPSNVIFTATGETTDVTGNVRGGGFRLNGFFTDYPLGGYTVWTPVGNLTDNRGESLNEAYNGGARSLTFWTSGHSVKEGPGTAFFGSSALDMRNFANLLPSDGTGGNVVLPGFGIMGTWGIVNPVDAPSDVAAVPEPSQVAASLLLAAGIAGFVIVKRRQEDSDLEALAA